MALPGDLTDAKYNRAMQLLRQCKADENMDHAMQLLHEYKAEVDQELAAAIAVRFTNPGLGAVALDQPIFNLSQLKNEIAEAMNDTVADWIETVSDDVNIVGTGGEDAGIPEAVLPQLFLECFHAVDTRYRKVESILFPAGRVVDKLKMREHMRNHHKELFFLRPNEDSTTKAVRGILRGVGARLSSLQFDRKDITWLVKDSGLDKVALHYMVILVNLRLQGPQATVNINDCLDVQLYDSERHSKPVGGESISQGQACVVAFPAVFVGEKRWTAGYTLASSRGTITR
ncbi:unnamed protein product [Scytosiphon promiscuus]